MDCRSACLDTFGAQKHNFEPDIPILKQAKAE
jgi:hypothetical protein